MLFSQVNYVSIDTRIIIEKSGQFRNDETIFVVLLRQKFIRSTGLTFVRTESARVSVSIRQTTKVEVRFKSPMELE